MFDLQSPNPLQHLRLALHGCAKKTRIASFCEHKRDGLEKRIVANIRPNSAWINDDWILHWLFGLIKNIASDSAVAWHHQSGFTLAEAPFPRKAHIAFCICVQGVDLAHRQTGVISHQWRGRRVQGKVIAPGGDYKFWWSRYALHRRSRQHSLVRHAHGMDNIRLYLPNKSA